MGLLSLFTGELVGKGVASPVEAVGSALDKLFTSDAERMQAEAVMEKLRQQPHILQAEISKIEAAHGSVFVAGWRPAIGWVCALSLASYFLPRHILAAILWTQQSWNAQTLAPYPVQIDGLLELVFALLGLGLLRTTEKMGKVARP